MGVSFERELLDCRTCFYVKRDPAGGVRLPRGFFARLNMKPKLLEIVPLIPSGDSLAAALAFYTEHMGFSVVWQSEAMAGIRRDGIAFNIVANDERAWADNASFSIGVSDLEALYQEYREVPVRVGPL